MSRRTDRGEGSVEGGREDGGEWSKPRLTLGKEKESWSGTRISKSIFPQEIKRKVTKKGESYKVRKGFMDINLMGL